jgi:hypothetical protein
VKINDSASWTPNKQLGADKRVASAKAKNAANVDAGPAMPPLAPQEPAKFPHNDTPASAAFELPPTHENDGYIADGSLMASNVYNLNGVPPRRRL